jgi:hypothetical protein
MNAMPVYLTRVFLLRRHCEEGVDVVEHDADRDGVLIRAGADQDVEVKVRRIAVEGVIGDDPVTKRELNRNELRAFIRLGDNRGVGDRVADEGRVFLQVMRVLVHQRTRALQFQLSADPCCRRVDVLDEDGDGRMVRAGGVAENSRMTGLVVLQPVEGDAQDCECDDEKRKRAEPYQAGQPRRAGRR